MYKILVLFFAIGVISCAREVNFTAQELQKFKAYQHGERFKMLGSLDNDTLDFEVLGVRVDKKITDAPMSRRTNYEELITEFVVYKNGVKSGSGFTMLSSLDKKLLKVDVRVNSTCGHYYGFPDLSRLESYTLNNMEYKDVAVYGGIYYSVSKGFLKMHACTNVSRIFE
jgi:hypothetical protein